MRPRRLGIPASSGTAWNRTMKSWTATLILWMRSDGDSEGERMISRARNANVLDHVEKACQVEDIGSIIVVTNSRDMAKALRDYPVILETAPDLGSVPFGEKMRSVIEKYALGTVLYVGGGSGVFMEIEDMARMTQATLASPEMLLVNNFYSTDFAAFGRASELKALRRCQQDNQLGRVLGREEGVRTCVLPSSLVTRFDIDTPTDLMILKAHPPRGRHLSRVVLELPIDASRLFRVMDVLVHRDGQAMVMGRIPPEVALSFDRETACHLTFHIEERGMETRNGDKGIWSLVGLCLEKLGISCFFQALSTHAHTAIVDSRVLFRHLGLRPSRQDRFFSDLLKPDEITDPSVRLFTEAARQSPVPFVLGGHTLVSGGLYALAQSAWERVREPLKRDIEELQTRAWKESGSGHNLSKRWKELENGCFRLRQSGVRKGPRRDRPPHP